MRLTLNITLFFLALFFIGWLHSRKHIRCVCCSISGLYTNSSSFYFDCGLNAGMNACISNDYIYQFSAIICNRPQFRYDKLCCIFGVSMETIHFSISNLPIINECHLENSSMCYLSIHLSIHVSSFLIHTHSCTTHSLSQH